MSAIDRVRIMVVGDSGVGKTSFVHLATHNEPIKSPGWTVGCSVEVKLHEYKEGTPEQTTYFLEFWDVGGSHIHRNTRHVFYNPCHGVILVHDLTNSKSEKNLNKWLKELINRDVNASLISVVSNLEDIDQENIFDSTQLPLLVIGCKLDQVEDKKFATRTSQFASRFGVDEIVLDSLQARYLAPGTSNAVKLTRFYDRVIERRYSKQASPYASRSRFSNLSNTISPTLPSKYYSPTHQD